jgi:hypothetical protein
VFRHRHLLRQNRSPARPRERTIRIVAQKHSRRVKSLEQLVEEHPDVQFFRDVLGMQQDAIRGHVARCEQHWLRLVKTLLAIPSSAGKPPKPVSRARVLVAVSRRVLARLRSLPITA